MPVIYVGVAAAAYLLVIKPLMDNFGGSAEDTNAVNEVDNYNPSESPFSFQFQPYKDLYNWPSDDAQWQFYQNIKNQYDDELLDKGSHIYLICYHSEIIWDAFGFWHNARIDNIFAVFNSLQYQTDVSEIAAYLWANHQTDLWYWLKFGYTFLPNIRNGLSDKNLAILIHKVENLPENPDQ